MYCEYFGLKEPPFSIAPNPHYLFMSQRHQDALAHLLYGVQSEGGFVLLSGEVGTGKTTLCRCLLEQIPDNTDVAFILNPFLGTNELLHAICKELGIEGVQANATLRQLTETMYQFLLDNHANGRNTVLVIDEAQHLQFKTLELIRLLTNLETNTKKLLQIIFIGQPELNTLLAEPKLRQLSQRITARFHIAPLTLEETQSYIHHRLRVAGLPGNQPLLPDGIIKKIYKTTGGIPRLINVLCDRALLGAYVQNKHSVDKQTLQKAIVEIQGEKSRNPRAVSRIQAAIAAGLLAAIAIGIWLYPSSFSPEDSLDTRVNKAGFEGSISATPSTTSADDKSMVAQGIVDRALPDYRLPTQALAVKHLLASAYGVDIDNPNPCLNLEARNMSCEITASGNWKTLKRINRPAVLSLRLDDGTTMYLPVIRMGATTVQTVTEGEVVDIPLTELEAQWSGELLFIWRPPIGFSNPIGVNDNNAVVAWLAKAFATLDNKSQPLTDTRFTPALKQRVMIFQRQHQLLADGVVGVNTLLRLNERLGLANTLMPVATPSGSRLPSPLSATDRPQFSNAGR